MLAALWAVAVTIAGLLVIGWWFGVHRRRLVETEAGVQSLANMKWRECIGLVLEALQKEGYREDRADRHVSDGGAEYLLTRGNEKILLSYKHGTAYRIGEANVRDFANGVQMQGATSGMLITLGAAESTARELAKRYGVQLIDGAALWPKIQGYAPVSISAHVKSIAATQTQQGMWMGATASVVLGIVTFLVGNFLSPADSSAQTNAQAGGVAAAVHSSAPVVEDPTVKQINETARLMAQVANLTDQRRAERRVKAAKEVSAIVQIGSAGWTTQSTLQLNLKQTDGQDADLIAEVCRILTQYEELRFTRVQIDPPDQSNTPVRWRQCQ